MKHEVLPQHSTLLRVVLLLLLLDCSAVRLVCFLSRPFPQLEHQDLSPTSVKELPDQEPLP